jgi:hypothetical protein
LSIIGKIDHALEWFSTVRSRLAWMLGLATLDTAYAYYVSCWRTAITVLGSPFWFGDHWNNHPHPYLKELFALVECPLPLMIALLLGDSVGL